MNLEKFEQELDFEEFEQKINRIMGNIPWSERRNRLVSIFSLIEDKDIGEYLILAYQRHQGPLYFLISPMDIITFIVENNNLVLLDIFKEKFARDGYSVDPYDGRTIIPDPMKKSESLKRLSKMDDESFELIEKYFFFDHSPNGNVR